MKKLIVLLMLVTVLSISTSYAAAPQDDQKISLDLKNVELQTALKALFSFKPGANFVLEPGASGHVDINVRDISFDSALKLVLRTNGLTYRIVDQNIYSIGPKKPATSVSKDMTNTIRPVSDYTASAASTTETVPQKFVTEKIPLNYADTWDMYNILNGNPSNRLGSLASGSMNNNNGGFSPYGSSGYGGGYTGYGYGGNNSSGWGSSSYGNGFNNGFNGGSMGGYAPTTYNSGGYNNSPYQYRR